MRQYLSSQNLLAELQYRETFNIAAAATIMVFASSLLLGMFNQFLNKAKMAEFYFFTTDFKIFVQDHYAYTRSFPNSAQLDRYLAGAVRTEYFQYLTLEGYGVVGNHYWFSFQGATANDITGRVSLLPHPVTESGSIVWLCGYAEHPRIDSLPTATPQTTISRDYLVNICQ